MTDHDNISRRKILQFIFGASVLLTQSNLAFAEDSGFGDADGDETDEEIPPFSSFTNQNGNLPNPHPIIKPNPNIGRVLNQDEVKAAIASGNAATLPLLLAFLNLNYPGKVLDVKLRAIDKNYIYEVKLLSNAIFLRTVTLDAKTMKKF